MKANSLHLICLTLLILSCKKTTTNNNTPPATTTPTTTYTGGLTTIWQPNLSTYKGVFTVNNDMNGTSDWQMLAKMYDISNNTLHMGILSVNGNTCQAVAPNGSNYSLNSANWSGPALSGSPKFIATGNSTNSINTFTYLARPMPNFNVTIDTTQQFMSLGFTINHTSITADTIYYVIDGVGPVSAWLIKKKAGNSNQMFYSSSEVAPIIPYPTGLVSITVQGVNYASTTLSGKNCIFMSQSSIYQSIKLNP